MRSWDSRLPLAASTRSPRVSSHSLKRPRRGLRLGLIAQLFLGRHATGTASVDRRKT